MSDWDGEEVIAEKFVEWYVKLRESIKKDEADQTDLDDLQKILDGIPESYGGFYDLADMVEYATINFLFPKPFQSMAIGTNVKMMREELGYDDADVIERLLIRNLVVCWLKLEYEEQLHSYYCNKDGTGLSHQLDAHMKRLSMAQKHFRNACREYIRKKRWLPRIPDLKGVKSSNNDLKIKNVEDVTQSTDKGKK